MTAPRAIAMVTTLCLVGCPRAASTTPPRIVESPETTDASACRDLCSAEKSCGSKESECVVHCDEERARTKPGFLTAYVKCVLPSGAKCPSFGKCADATARAFPRDEKNQRIMAEAVCGRAKRCQGIGEDGRLACIEATLHPHEADEQEGAHLVDVLRRDRVEAFGKCVDEAACAKTGEPDLAPERCYDEKLVGKS